MSLVNGLANINFNPASVTGQPPPKKIKISKEDTVGKFNLVSNFYLPSLLISEWVINTS